VLSTPPCPGPEGGRWKGSLPEGERQRLAALAAATTNALLVIFVLAVLLHEPLGDAVLERLCQAVQPALAAPTGTEILRHGGL